LASAVTVSAGTVTSIDTVAWPLSPWLSVAV